MASFKHYRRSAASSAVAPLGVVKHLDVVKDIGPLIVTTHILSRICYIAAHDKGSKMGLAAF